MLEKDLQAKVMKWLRTQGPDMWVTKVSDRFMVGVPDIIGCYKGQMFAIELKVGKNKPTEIQKVTLAKMQDAACKTAVAWSMEEVQEFIGLVKDIVNSR